MSEFDHMDRADLIALAVEMRNQRDLAHQRMQDWMLDSVHLSLIRNLNDELAAARRENRRLSESLFRAERKREEYGGRNGGLATSNRHLRAKLAKLQAAPFAQHIWVASVH